MSDTTTTETAGPLDDVERGEKPTTKKTNGAAGPPRAATPPIRRAGERPPLKELRATLAPDARKIVAAARDHFEAELIEVFPEIVAGVSTSSAEASFSTTLQIKSAKKHKLKATMSARVRSPREPLEMDMHLALDGQLGLGWDGLEDEDAEGEE